MATYDVATIATNPRDIPIPSNIPSEEEEIPPEDSSDNINAAGSDSGSDWDSSSLEITQGGGDILLRGIQSLISKNLKKNEERKWMNYTDIRKHKIRMKVK